MSRIVVAEDDSLIRLDLVDMLNDEGYDVVGQAPNGQLAVDLAAELRPDVVIMDIKMPVRDGLDAAKEIISQRYSAVVMLTAFAQRDFIDQARTAGAMAYVVKPFTQSDIVPAIELAISRYRELCALENEVANLADRLETRTLIDQAKAILITAQNLTEPEAFAWIQHAAMDKRTTMKVVAGLVIETLGPAATKSSGAKK